MGNYYNEKLNSNSLVKIYETDIPRIRQFLTAEIDFVKSNLKKTDRILEVASGYGRILKALSESARCLTGIDISEDFVNLSKDYLKDCKNCKTMTMDVHTMDFTEPFDVILCLQNGLSAVKGVPEETIKRCLDFLKPQGKAYFSTYSSNFWNTRLEWFKEQADKGLLGEIDDEKTKDGVIICKDGFKAITFTEEDFYNYGKASQYPFTIEEVDESSLFLIITKP
ncbi:MAG: class I SAM-dependent methyltransferase [Eubacterium sp.]